MPPVPLFLRRGRRHSLVMKILATSRAPGSHATAATGVAAAAVDCSGVRHRPPGWLRMITHCWCLLLPPIAQVVTISGLSQLEDLVKKHPFVVAEASVRV